MKSLSQTPQVWLYLMMIVAFVLGMPGNSFSDTTEQYNHALSLKKKGTYPQAYKLLLGLAEQEHAEAQFDIGYLYDFGLGVPKDQKKSLEWYRRSAKNGSPRSLAYLGSAYSLGKGDFPKDRVQAKKLYLLAAEQGHARAQSFLGGLYFSGNGIPKNKVQAYKWWALSEKHFSSGKQKKFAREDLNQLKKKMTSGQIAEAEKLVREWKPKSWEELSGHVSK